jgi:hypothetical protein
MNPSRDWYIEGVECTLEEPDRIVFVERSPDGEITLEVGSLLFGSSETNRLTDDEARTISNALHVATGDAGWEGVRAA